MLLVLSSWHRASLICAVCTVVAVVVTVVVAVYLIIQLAATIWARIGEIDGEPPLNLLKHYGYPSYGCYGQGCSPLASTS
jgi:hypothetical protein